MHQNACGDANWVDVATKAENVRLLIKEGGRSGLWRREEGAP